MQALRVNTISKLTFADCKQFDSLIGDVFPGVQLKRVEQEVLRDALQQVAKEMRLEVIETQVNI